MKIPIIDGIDLKKKFGQHFLKDKNLLHRIVDSVELDKTSSVFEIGGGCGFLTKTILEKDIARLWVFEIDSDWADYLQKNIDDSRLSVFFKNILDENFSDFEEHKPWTLIANLPYQVTFPIFYMLVNNIKLLKEGVVMIQEEVAQKIVKSGGRDYGYPSLYLQYYFDFKLLDKVPPSVFYPPPKVDSRVIHFVPKKNRVDIPEAQKFWKFIKMCFSQPRRTLGNNLKTLHFDLNQIDPKILALRAQQMKFDDFLNLWKSLNK